MWSRRGGGGGTAVRTTASTTPSRCLVRPDSLSAAAGTENKISKDTAATTPLAATTTTSSSSTPPPPFTTTTTTTTLTEEWLSRLHHVLSTQYPSGAEHLAVGYAYVWPAVAHVAPSCPPTAARLLQPLRGLVWRQVPALDALVRATWWSDTRSALGGASSTITDPDARWWHDLLDPLSTQASTTETTTTTGMDSSSVDLVEDEDDEEEDGEDEFMAEMDDEEDDEEDNGYEKVQHEDEAVDEDDDASEPPPPQQEQSKDRTDTTTTTTTEGNSNGDDDDDDNNNKSGEIKPDHKSVLETFVDDKAPTLDELEDGGDDDDDDEEDSDDADEVFGGGGIEDDMEDEDEGGDDDDEDDEEMEEEDEDEVHSMESVEVIGETEDATRAKDRKGARTHEGSRNSDTTTAVGPDTKIARTKLLIRACVNVLRTDGYHPALTQHLIQTIRPPAQPVQTRILLRRAPTQEEFFRGSISRNPVPMSALPGGPDPTVGDLRQHIANELQMAESAELIEILVGNKIVDVNLRLRVVNQVVWKQHLVNGGSNAVFTAGTISILWTSDRRITSDTPIEALPPMVATYRLTGVDGEATEDTVDHLADPKESDCTRDAAEEARIQLVDPLVVLENTRVAVAKLVQKARRDQVDGNFEIKDVPPGLQLLKLCSVVHGPTLLRAGAPTVLLKWLLDLLKVSREANEVSELLQSLIEHLSTLDMATASDINTGAAQQLPSLLESIQSMDLPESLCVIVAKLLPFLTYGQPSLSRELAIHMKKNIDADHFGQNDTPILVKTLVQTIINLPRDEMVCDVLRTELVRVGLAKDMANFILRDLPPTPPPWTKALWQKGDRVATDLVPWQRYYARAPSLHVALEVLTGLGRAPAKLVQACHWLESTSDSPTVDTQGLGILSETLLDTLLKFDTTRPAITAIRNKTRQRKKEIAQERRTKALANMNLGNVGTKQAGLASILPRAFGGFFKESPTSPATKKRVIPDWMAEADSMKEETGLTCAVCQEGRTLQPKELLGLYSYVKKVSIPNDFGGLRLAIEGVNLLRSLPPSLPTSCVNNSSYSDYFFAAKSAAANLSTSDGSASSSRRTSCYTTTVSAGTGIHFNCHRRARSVDRNHPKAPKSEWEGAALRNNRVSCNVILPLVSQKLSSVPLRAVDAALSDHHSAISNLLGSTPKSALWTALHDVRLLMLRIAYDESLSTDCGGGSLTSNCQLVFHQFGTIEVFDKDAQVDQPQKSLHASGLPCGVVVACLNIENQCSSSSKATSGALVRDTAEASLMAGICSVLFHNGPVRADGTQNHHQWAETKTFFLRALLMMAGRRHAQGIHTSFCVSRRNSMDEMPSSSSTQPPSSAKASKHNLELYSRSIRPMMTLFLMLDQMAKEYSVGMEDVQTAAERLAAVVTSCRDAPTVGQLLDDDACDADAALSYFDMGIHSLLASDD